jgi:hypothetical protein
MIPRNQQVHLAAFAIGVVVGFLPSAFTGGRDTELIQALAAENANLKEQNEVQQKLIDTLKAECRELYKANPS